MLSGVVVAVPPIQSMYRTLADCTGMNSHRQDYIDISSIQVNAHMNTTCFQWATTSRAYPLPSPDTTKVRCSAQQNETQHVTKMKRSRYMCQSEHFIFVNDNKVKYKLHSTCTWTRNK
jgi:hypothetical protein